MPGVGAPPRGQRQNPGAIPWMQNGSEQENGPEHPQHSSFPIPNEEQRDHDDGHNENDVVMVIFLMRIGPDCIFNHPPKKIVEPLNVSERSEEHTSELQSRFGIS